MAQTLTSKEVEALDKPGIHRVAENLYCQVKNGGKSWILRYQVNGKARSMGLGPYKLVPLKDAKEKSLKLRRELLEGFDPLEARRAQRQRRRTSIPNFSKCVERYIADHQSSWKNPKHAAQWESTLKTYADPIIGKLLPSEVTVQDIVQILQPIWSSKSETAGRLRGRIEKVLDWAKVHGFRAGDNPAAWKGALSHLLPPLSRVQKVEHHAATPYSEMPKVLARLAALRSTSAKALIFTALTAARTGETLGATWREVDFEARLWTVPADRMKAGKEHRVPLSNQCVALLKDLRGRKTADSDYIFPGQRPRKPMSNMAMLQCLRGVRPDETVHGFRSAFSTWAPEQTDHPREIIEASLAHTIGNAVEQAYARTTFLEKRRALMAEWAVYIFS